MSAAAKPKRIGSDNCMTCNAPLETFELKIEGECKECREKFWKQHFSELGQRSREFRDAAAAANEPLKRLAQVLCGRSGQPYKVRALLYSLWNGKPWTLNDLVCLDWKIKQDLCALMLGWGHDAMFYKQLENAVREAGQWDWFLEECDNVQLLREYVTAAENEKGAKP